MIFAWPSLYILTLLVVSGSSLNFRLNRNRQYCFEIVGNNTYEFEFIVSGEGQNNVQCRIQDQQQEIKAVSYINQYEATFTIQGQKGQICFSSLDNHPKMVSFDFISIFDPKKSQTNQGQRSIAEQKLMNSYQLMERLYRNQHFYLERSKIHQQMLDDVQLKVSIMIGWKIILVATCGFLQLFAIKKIIDKKGMAYTPLNLVQSHH